MTIYSRLDCFLGVAWAVLGLEIASVDKTMDYSTLSYKQGDMCSSLDSARTFKFLSIYVQKLTTGLLSSDKTWLRASYAIHLSRHRTGSELHLIY